MGGPDWLAAQKAEGALPPELPLRCTQGPGDMLLLPGHWSHATVNSAFTIGIGNLYCDALFANYTHDTNCRRYYPHAGPNPAQRALKRNLVQIVREALGPSYYAPDGAIQWPKAQAQPAIAVPPPERAVPPASAVAPSASYHASSPFGRGRGRGRGRRRLELQGRSFSLSGAKSFGPNASRQPPMGAAKQHAAFQKQRGEMSPRGLVASVPVRPECAKGQPAYKPVAFVHINKAGGTAMRARLFKLARHQMLEASSVSAMTRVRTHARYAPAHGKPTLAACGPPARAARTCNPRVLHYRTDSRRQLSSRPLSSRPCPFRYVRWALASSTPPPRCSRKLSATRRGAARTRLPSCAILTRVKCRCSTSCSWRRAATGKSDRH